MRSLLFLALVLLAGCSFNERVDGILELTGVPADGEVVWAAECARCHADDGTGNDLGPGILAELHHGDAQILTWILDGKGAEMPAFPELTDQDAADVLAHLHALADG